MTENRMNQPRTERSSAPPAVGGEHRRLDVFIGRWINEGHTVAGPDAPSVRIVTSDVYEWAPGGHFVLHYAYGFAGNMAGGGIEIMGYDAAKGRFFKHFFDSQGNVVISDLTERDGVWTWEGDWAGQGHRATATFSDGGRIQTCLHERSVDGSTWEPSMEIVLTKAE